jgi:HK97 family phage major capsid protein
MNAHTPVAHANFTEFVRAVLTGAISGSFDPNLIKSAVATGAAEGIGSAGGFLVPDNVAQEIWTRVYAMGRILARCDRQPVTRGSGIKIPAISELSRTAGSRFGGVQLGWTGEGGLAPSGKPNLDLLDLELKKLLGIVYATDELVQDAPALAAFLRRMLAMEAEFKIEDEIVNGIGTAGPLGVLNSGALITVAKEGGQSASTVAYLNLTNMAARLWGPSHRSAIWLMSNDVFNLILQLTTAEGSEVVETGDDGVRRVLSMPVELCEYTPALGAAGDILLCDFSQYLLAEREPNFDSSIHVQFSTDETAFRFRFRADGQPGWKSPVTPKNSSTTQSPFIALAARP